MVPVNPLHELFYLPDEECGILTESGILFPDGEIITEGKILEVARKCEKFLGVGDSEGFDHYLRGPSGENGVLDNELTREESLMLQYQVRISGGKYLDGIHRITNLSMRIMCGDQGWFVYPNPQKA